MQDGFRLFGFVFVSNGPARALGGDPQRFVQVSLVDLDDRAINLVGEVMASILQCVQGGQDRLDIIAGPEALDGGDSPLAQLLDHVGVCVKADALNGPGSV